MKSKKLVIVCLIIVILAAIITNIYIISNKDELEENKIEGIDIVNNQEILKDTSIEGLEITNISLLTRDGISTYKAEVTNTTDNELVIDKLYVVFYENDNENKIVALSNVTLRSNIKTYINITSESDLSSSTDIKYLLETNNEE